MPKKNQKPKRCYGMPFKHDDCMLDDEKTISYLNWILKGIRKKGKELFKLKWEGSILWAYTRDKNAPTK